MLDEEMAEEYAENNAYKYANDHITCYEAFLAGLKAGKNMNVSTGWHSVAAGDLPPVERGSATIDVLTNSGVIAYYYYDDSCWCDCNGNEIDPPKAWCEIPKYEEV